MEPRDMEQKRGANPVRVPEVQLPTRETQLRSGLMALGRQSHADRRRKEVFIMKPNVRTVGSVVAAVAVAGSFAVFLVAGQGAGPASAVATFQVNPAFSIIFDAENEVVDVTSHNEDGELLLEGVELEGVALDDAVAVLAGELDEAGYLPENDVAVAVHPTGDGTEQDAAAVANVLEDSLRAAVGEDVSAIVVTLSEEDYRYLADNGLLPGDYANFVLETGTIETIRALMDTYKSDAQDGELPADWLKMAVEAVNDMIEVGLSPSDAVALIEATVAAANTNDLDIDELADTYEEFVDTGMRGADALTLMTSGIVAGLGTNDLEDVADLYLELRERGMPPETTLALINAQIAAGWDAEAVDEYADRFEEQREADSDERKDAEEAAEDAREDAEDARRDAEEDAEDAREESADDD